MLLVRIELTSNQENQEEHIPRTTMKPLECEIILKREGSVKFLLATAALGK